MNDKVVTVIAVACLVGLALPSLAAWDPSAFHDEGTLEILTIDREDGEHWSKVWLVVLDDQVYIRLGNRAAGRIERNTTAPFLRVKVAGQEFARVRAEPVPEMAERVAHAMAQKYWTDLFVRFFSHPLTMRLTPEGQSAGP